ncbi:MAG: hypothetical protein IPK26_20095 [Planctomycetes bacterium]|nr:hypothetical protein [Planctomycetota bacterium]
MHATTLLPRALLLLLAPMALAQKTPDEALAALKAGNQRFVEERSVPQPLGEGVRRTLARGQNPFAIVLTCSDSRVPPEHLFNAGLGELFVVRVAGNTVDQETLASIEYAAEHLGATLCVVLGHERCGAIAACVHQVQAANDGKPVAAESPAIQQLLEQLEPAVRKAHAHDLGGDELLARAEEENAQGTAQDCLRRSPLLRRLQQAQRFQVLPARYHLASGQVEWLPPRPLPAPAGHDAAPAHVTASTMPPHVALRLLQAGHRRFLSDGRPTADLSQKRRENLTQGQQPLAIVVTCADSRVAPEHLFDAGLGELFVVRVAGNAIDDDGLASIEYAAAHTGASLLVVLGHSACGAITAAADAPHDPHHTTNLRALLQRLEPAVERARASGKTGRDLVELAVRGNAMRALVEARSRSALLRQLERDGKFAMLAAVYDLASGDVEWLKDGEASADVAEPPAAPGGEIAPRAAGHGSPDDGHGHAKAGHGGNDHAAMPHEGHDDAHDTDHGDAHGAAHDDHRTAPHGADDDDMPWLEQAPARPPASHKKPTAGRDPHATSGAEAHGDDSSHASPADHGSHGKQGHDAGHGDTHDEHGEDHQGHGDDDPAEKRGLDPVLVIGGVGITSLLLAAVLAMRKG